VLSVCFQCVFAAMLAVFLESFVCHYFFMRTESTISSLTWSSSISTAKNKYIKSHIIMRHDNENHINDMIHQYPHHGLHLSVPLLHARFTGVKSALSSEQVQLWMLDIV
jgi:hypothetical protein